MFRKLFLSAVVGTGLTTGLTLTPATADAQPPAEYHHHYVVMYRYDCHGRWHCYDTFHHLHDAERAVHHLRHRGYEAFVRS